jgi:hypothetical protein
MSSAIYRSQHIAAACTIYGMPVVVGLVLSLRLRISYREYTEVAN